MDLSKACSCLNNTAQIDGTINNGGQIASTVNSSKQVDSTMTGLTTVHIAYTAGETDNIIVNIDKQTRVITATKKDIQFASKDQFPTIGSAKLIYVALDTNVTYIWNTELQEYVAIGKDYTEEIIDINEAIKLLQDNTYTKEEVDNITSSIPKFKAEIVTQLPSENISTTTIYLILKPVSENQDEYDEYMYINSRWERIGGTKIDLSNYADLSSKQLLSNKEFDSIGLVGEGIIPIYEDKEEVYNYEYTIENLSSTYGFYLNDAGYYESNNKNIINSYALCKVSFNMWKSGDLVFELINSGESNYDFGIFSKLDQTLSSSHNEDTSSTLVYKSYKGLSSTTPVTLTYTEVPAGEHFITIKFRKDSSSNQGLDCLQFKVISPVGDVVIVTPEIVGYEDYIANLDIDEDKDLTYAGEKVVTDKRFKDIEEALPDKVDSSDMKTLTIWTVFPDNYAVSGNTIQWKGTITDNSKVYNPIGQSNVDVGGNIQSSALIPRSVFDKLVGVHNSLTSEIVKVYQQGFLTEVPSATKETIGGVRIWVEGDTLYISTSRYDNIVEGNTLQISGAYRTVLNRNTISVN